MAFYQLEPWGEDWYQTGMLASIVGNLAGRSPGEPPFTAKDFMPNFDPPKDRSASEIGRLIAFGKTLKEAPKNRA